LAEPLVEDPPPREREDMVGVYGDFGGFCFDSSSWRRVVSEEEGVIEGSRGDCSSVGEGGVRIHGRSRAKRPFGLGVSLEDFFYFFLR